MKKSCYLYYFLHYIFHIFINPFLKYGQRDYNSSSFVRKYLLISSKCTISDYPGFNNLILNYKGECNKIFKYEPNSKKDVVIFAYGYYNKKKDDYIYHMIPKVIDSFRYSTPNARLVCLVQKKYEKNKVVDLLRKLKIEIYIKEGFDDWLIVNARFPIMLKFLEENKGKINKVISADLNDVFAFNDVFATFSKDELVANYVCFNYKENTRCAYVATMNDNYVWFRNSFGPQITEEIKRYHYINICAGLIFGGYNKFYQLIKLLSEGFDWNNKQKIKNFGYDESLLNKLYYYDKKLIGLLKPEGNNQRISFDDSTLVSNSKGNILVFKSDGCSPVLVHKSIPRSWFYQSKLNADL